MRDLLMDVEIQGARNHGLPMDVRINPDPPVGLPMDVTIDNLIAEAAQPRGVAPQTVSWLVKIDGEVLRHDRIGPGPISVTRDRESGVSFTLPLVVRGDHLAPFGESPVGRVEDYLGPPPGKAAIDIYGVHHTASGAAIAIPLVTGGRVTSSSEGTSPETVVLQGSGRLSRYANALVEVVLPPGHGLPRGKVQRRFMRGAGWPDAEMALADGNRMMKAVPKENAAPVAFCRELGEPENRLFNEGPDGVLINPVRVGVDEEAQVVGTDDEFLVLAGSAVRTARADVPTLICLTGTKQVERPECGLTDVITTSESFGIYSPRVALWEQTGPGTGVITSTGNVQPPADLIRTQRTTKVVTYECDTIVLERTVTDGWYNPQHYRYGLGTDGSIDSYAQFVFFYDDAVVTDDTAAAYAWETERFVTVSDLWVEHVFDDRGMEVETRERAAGWNIRQTAIKTRNNAGEAWDAQSFIGGLRVLGDGTGVADDQEYFYFAGNNGGPLHRGVVYPGSSSEEDRRNVTTTRTVTDDGFELGSVEQVEEYGMAPGINFLFQGGREGIAQTDYYGETGRTVHINTVQDGEASYSSSTIVFGANGQIVEQHNEQGEGYLPAAEQVSAHEPDPSIYEDGEDPGGAGIASPFDQQQMEVEYEAVPLLQHHYPQSLKANNQWAENEDELGALAYRMARESSSWSRTYAVPANFTVLENTLRRLLIRRAGVDETVEVVSVNWTGGGGARDPIVTTISGLVAVI